MTNNVIKFSKTPVSEVEKQFLKLKEQQQQIEEQRKQIEALKEPK